MPIPLVAAGTSSAWLPYLLAIGATGTYAMNRDRLNRMAGSFNIPWPGSRNTEDDILWKDGSVSDSQGTVITANPGSTDSEFDGKTIVYPPGPLVHSPAGELVGTGGGNGGNGGDDDKRYWQNARWSALGEIPSVFSRLFDKASDVDPYEAGRIEREEQEWGPGGQPSASDQIDAYEKSKWLERTRNSPAARAGLDPDARWSQKKMNDDFQVYRDAGDLEGFARKYPQSQTAKKMRRDAPYGRPVDF